MDSNPIDTWQLVAMTSEEDELVDGCQTQVTELAGLDAQFNVADVPVITAVLLGDCKITALTPTIQYNIFCNHYSKLMQMNVKKIK